MKSPKDIKVLIACECSGRVRDAFLKLGFDAWSCDLKDCETNPERHLKGDVLEFIGGGYDMMIGHPPCNYISYAGTSSWNNPGRITKRLDALEFFRKLWEAPIPHIALENPKSCASPVIAKYTQEIQPYFFGDREIKTTWLWLKNLPPLQHYENDNLFFGKTHTERPEPISVDNTPRKKKRYFTDAKVRNPAHRAVTFKGIADAMAQQWGNYLLNPTGSRK